MTDEPSPGRRKRVRRGEGEVTEWPRGLVDYTPSGAPDDAPSPDEDRDWNRLRIAARLLGSARTEGRAVEPLVERLRDAERALRQGERAKGRRIVDEVTSEAGALLGGGTGSPEPPP